MNDKPNPSEIKPSLTVPYAVLVLATTAIIASTTFWMTRAWESWSVEKKTILLNTASSQNLATTPEGLASTLEFRLVLSPTDKQIIKSVFIYQVSVHNQSGESVENIALHLFPPPNVTLIDPPRITTDSKVLADFVLQSKRVLEKEIVFDLDLLGPGQRVTLAYSGFSKEAIIDGSFIDVEARKKGWEIRKVIPGYTGWYDTATGQTTVSHPGYTGGSYYPDFEPYDRGIWSVLSKRITAYNGGDVISLLLLLVMVICASGLLIWLLARVLFDPLKLLHGWRSLVERLFRRAS